MSKKVVKKLDVIKTNKDAAPIAAVVDAGPVVEPKPKVVKKEMHEFVSQKLKMLADSLFRYDCFEVAAVDKEVFICEAAKSYGIRSGDIIHLVDNDSVKTIVV